MVLPFGAYITLRETVRFSGLEGLNSCLNNEKYIDFGKRNEYESVIQEYKK